MQNIVSFYIVNYKTINTKFGALVRYHRVKIMAVERLIIFAFAAASLISMACAIPGTATFYTVYVRKFRSLFFSLEISLSNITFSCQIIDSLLNPNSILNYCKSTHWSHDYSICMLWLRGSRHVDSSS